MGGAVVATGAVLGGTAAGLTGGIGGAWMNIKDGSSEVYESSKTRFSSQSHSSLPAAAAANTGRKPLLLKDQQRKSTSELGKQLWHAGISS